MKSIWPGLIAILLGVAGIGIITSGMGTSSAGQMNSLFLFALTLLPLLPIGLVMFLVALASTGRR